jgi:hypothetical protein
VKLSAEQFETILASLRSFSETDRSVEKRRSPRVGLRATATMIHCTGSGANARQHEVNLRDLSAEGIGLTHTEPLRTGTYVLISFTRAVGEVLRVLYRVAHCERLGERSYAIGARLDRVLTPEDAVKRRPGAAAV